MKELSIEEKARRYDEVIESAKEWSSTKNGYYTPEELCKEIFPELVESEDEKIRKAIIEFFESQDDNTTYSLVPKKDILAWLEKQGGQKPTKASYTTIVETGNGGVTTVVERNLSTDGCCGAWSEEDETTRNNISHIIKQYDKISKRNNQPCWYVGDCLLWMQNIKGRIKPQLKQEWSREDDEMLDSIAENCPEKVYLWAKNIHPHKISVDEAIRVLEEAADGVEIPNKYRNSDWLNELDKVLETASPEQLKEWKEKYFREDCNEWSEEDESIRNGIIDHLREYYVEKKGYPYIADKDSPEMKERRWFESLCLQSHWKPSEEQIISLKQAIKNMEDSGCYHSPLVSLYNDLKAL